MYLSSTHYFSLIRFVETLVILSIKTPEYKRSSEYKLPHKSYLLYIKHSYLWRHILVNVSLITNKLVLTVLWILPGSLYSTGRKMTHRDTIPHIGSNYWLTGVRMGRVEFFKICFRLHQVLLVECGIYFPDQGLNLGPPALGVKSPSHWTPVKSQVLYFSLPAHSYIFWRYNPLHHHLNFPVTRYVGKLLRYDPLQIGMRTVSLKTFLSYFQVQK